MATFTIAQEQIPKVLDAFSTSESLLTSLTERFSYEIQARLSSKFDTLAPFIFHSCLSIVFLPYLTITADDVSVLVKV